MKVSFSYKKVINVGIVNLEQPETSKKSHEKNTL